MVAGAATQVSLPAVSIDAKSCRQRVKAGGRKPLDATDRIVITSYEFAARRPDNVRRIGFGTSIARGTAARAKALRDAVRGRFKMLLTATPLQNSLMELYGLASVIDERLFGDEASFRTHAA